MPKILIVEDDKDLVMIVQNWLKAEYYSVDAATDGLTGFEYLKQAAYDVIILDWDLPGMPGVEICRRYRRDGGNIPILMLTGKNKIDNKEEGFDAGADDYLTKPFEMRELSARVRSLLRRPPTTTDAVLRVGKLEMDPAKHQVTSGGVALRLTRKDFELLECLMRNPDTFFNIETLIERAWSFDSEASASAVRTAIKRLRQSIDDGDSEEESMIESIRGVGYRMKSAGK